MLQRSENVVRFKLPRARIGGLVDRFPRVCVGVIGVHRMTSQRELSHWTHDSRRLKKLTQVAGAVPLRHGGDAMNVNV
jgi:hypothetical protein